MENINSSSAFFATLASVAFSCALSHAINVASWQIPANTTPDESVLNNPIVADGIDCSPLTKGTGCGNWGMKKGAIGAKVPASVNSLESAEQLAAYVEFSITAATNCSLSAETIAFTTSRSASGPTSGRWYHIHGNTMTPLGDTSIAFLEATTANSVNIPSNICAIAPGETADFRLYLWGSSSTQPLYLHELTLSGSLTLGGSGQPSTSPPMIGVIPDSLVMVSETLQIEIPIAGTDGDPILATNLWTTTQISGEYALTNGLFSYTPSPEDTDHGQIGFFVAATDKDGTTTNQFYVTALRIPDFIETFDSCTKSTYAPADALCDTGLWSISNALAGGSASDAFVGTKALRLRSSESHAMTLFDKPRGASSISFYIGGYSGDNGEASVTLSGSSDGGVSWLPICTVTEVPLFADACRIFVTNLTFVGPFRLRIDSASAGRVNIDQIAIFDNPAPYLTPLPAALSDFSTHQGTPSAAQSFHLHASSLPAGALITAPTLFELSLTNSHSYAQTIALPPSSNAVATEVFVRLTGEAGGNGTIAPEGVAEIEADGTTAQIALSGIVYFNAPPTLEVQAEETSVECGLPLSVTLTATDADGPLPEITASSVPEIPGINDLLTPTTNGALFVWTPESPGEYTITFSANDGQGKINSVTSETITISVLAPAVLDIRCGETLSENFNSMGTDTAAPLPFGWSMIASDEAGVENLSFTDATTYTTRSGGYDISPSARAGLYNFGVDAIDRTPGFLSSSELFRSDALVLRVRNAGSATIEKFEISFDLKKYRRGTSVPVVTLKTSADGRLWTTQSTFSPLIASCFATDNSTTGYSQAEGLPTPVRVSGIFRYVLPPSKALFTAWFYHSGSSAQAIGIDNIQLTAIPSIQTIMILR